MPVAHDLAPLASVTSLEHVSLGIFSAVPIDLSPLTGLPRLKTISLKGHGAFDLSSLSGIRDAVITVPPSARIAGEDKLEPTSRVIRPPTPNPSPVLTQWSCRLSSDVPQSVEQYLLPHEKQSHFGTQASSGSRCPLRHSGGRMFGSQSAPHHHDKQQRTRSWHRLGHVFHRVPLADYSGGRLVPLIFRRDRFPVSSS